MEILVRHLPFVKEQISIQEISKKDLRNNHGVKNFMRKPQSSFAPWQTTS